MEERHKHKLNVHARPFIPGVTGRNLCIETPTPEQILEYKARKFGTDSNPEDNLDFALNISLDLEYESKHPREQKSKNLSEMITYTRKELLEMQELFKSPPLGMALEEEYRDDKKEMKIEVEELFRMAVAREQKPEGEHEDAAERQQRIAVDS